MREASARGEELRLSKDELAFYDALETNDSAVHVLGNDTLRSAGASRSAVRRGGMPESLNDPHSLPPYRRIETATLRRCRQQDLWPPASHAGDSGWFTDGLVDAHLREAVITLSEARKALEDLARAPGIRSGDTPGR